MDILLDYFYTSMGFMNSHPTLYIIVFFVLCKCISISPLKLDPMKFFGKLITKWLKWAGEIMMHDTNERLKDIETNMYRVEEENDKRRIKDLRQKILDFGDLIRTRTYNHEVFDNIYSLHIEYMDLLEKYELENGKVKRAMERIDAYYHEHEMDEDF